MKVTALRQQQRNPDRINVFIDGKYKLSLTMGQILQEKLKVGFELDAKILDSLILISEDEKFRLKALNWATLRPRSELELRRYIKQKTYRDNASRDYDWLIDDFVRRGWVNDSKFAEWWLSRKSSSTKSASILRRELLSKGINRAHVDDILSNIDDSTSLVELIKKLSQKSKFTDQQKLIRYLVSKGYSYSSIKEALVAATEDS